MTEEPGLGTLLRQLLDMLDSGSEAHYRQAGLSMRARYTPIMRLLGNGPRTVTELCERTGVTQGAVSQTVALMEKDGLVTRETGGDGRSRAVRFTDAGQALYQRLVPHWNARLLAISALEQEIGVPLRAALASGIGALTREGFDKRIANVSEN